MYNDSAIEAVADALETRCCSFSDGDGSLGYGHARREYERVARELLAAAYPQQTEANEHDAMIAAWTEFRKRNRKDAIRPAPRVDGRSYEAGWLAAKEFYAAYPQQIKHHKGSTKGDSASDVNPYPQQTEGESVQPRPVSVPASSGLPQATPHGPQSESAPSGDQWDVPKADAERASRSKESLLGASQPVGEDEQFYEVPGSRLRELGAAETRLIAAEQKYRKVENSYIELADKLRAAEQRAEQARRAAEFRWKKMRDRITELEQEAAAAKQRAERARADRIACGQGWSRTKEQRRTAEADRDRLQGERDAYKRQCKVLQANLDARTRQCDRLGRELDHEKRYNIECEAENADLRHERDAWILNSEAGKAGVSSLQLHDALRGLYNALDRYGWCTGRSMESRDTLLAKARAALREERPA